VFDARRDDLRHLGRLVRARDGAALAVQLADSVRLRTEPRISHKGVHAFTDRSEGCEQLLIVLAGYKPYLWPYTLARVEHFVPADVDVCIVSPGVAPEVLGELAGRRGWSWLSTRKNSLCLAQNIAIARHPHARYIHKLDEDVFIGAGHLERLLRGYRRVAAEGRYAPGFAAPILNVNGFSFRLFLDALGLTEDYRLRFGGLLQACMDVPAQADANAAFWLWQRSVPFDEIVARFAERPWGYTPVPHRFSIGAYVMERRLWEDFGGFAAHPYRDIGRDESQLCKECTDRSRVPVVVHDVFAGHWSFGPQEAAMRAALPALVEGLSLPAAMAGSAAAP
jgi:hypothetical protein